MMCCWWLPSCSAIAKSIRCCPVSLHEDCFFEPRIIRFRCRFCRLHKPATGDLQTSYFSCGCLAIYHQCIGVMLMCLWHLKSQKLITRSIPQPSSYVDQMNHLQAKAFDSGTTSFSQVWSLTQLYPNQEHNAGSKSWTWYFTGWRQCTANGWTNTRVRRSNRVHQHVLFWVENKWWVTNLDIDDGIIICILVWMPKRLIFSYRAFLPQHVNGRRTTPSADPDRSTQCSCIGFCSRSIISRPTWNSVSLQDCTVLKETRQRARARQEVREETQKWGGDVGYLASEVIDAHIWRQFVMLT